MINSWIRRKRKMMALGLGMALAFSTVFSSGVAKAISGYDSNLHFSWENVGVTAEEQNRFETYGFSQNSYQGTRPDGTTGSIKYAFALMIDHDKVWGANVAHNEGGHEKRYTSSVDEVYDFSNEFGSKAVIMVVKNDDFVTIPDSVSNRSLKSGTTVVVPVTYVARFKGANINAEAGVKFEALEYSFGDETQYGTFDFRSSQSHIVGSGLIMEGRPEYFVQKDYTVTQSGDYAIDVTINRGQALREASLGGEAVKWSAGVDGAWSFADGDTVPEVGEHTFDVVFSPTWNVNYVKKTFTGKGHVTVVDNNSGSGTGGNNAGSGGNGNGNNSGTGGSNGNTGAGGNGTGGTGSGAGSGSGNGTGGSGSGSGSNTGSGSGEGAGGSSGGSGGGNSGASPTPSASSSPLPSGSPSASPSPSPSGSPDAATGPAASLVDEQEVEPPVVIEKIVSDISEISSAEKPAKVKTTYVSRVGTTFTVKVQKVTKKKPTGYQIQYTTKKNSWKGAKSKKFKKLKMTIKGLKAGRRYYFRIRAYRKIKGQVVYGKWSKRKKI